MSKEIVVDREQLQNKMQSLINLISYVENGYECRANDHQMLIFDDTDENIYAVEFLDLDAVYSKYSDVELQTLTVDGISFVSVNNIVIECGIVKEKSNVAWETIVTAANSDLAKWGVDSYDVYNYTSISNGFNQIANLLWISDYVGKAYSKPGKNIDDIVDMGADITGPIGNLPIRLFSNIAMRKLVKDVLTFGVIGLEANNTVTIAEPEGDDVKIAWSDGQPVLGITYNDTSIKEVIIGAQNQMIMGIYRYFKLNLSQDLFARFEINNNIYVDGEAVVKAQNKIVA